MNNDKQVEELAKFLSTTPLRKIDLYYEGDRKIIADFIINEGYSKPPQTLPNAQLCNHSNVSPHKLYEMANSDTEKYKELMLAHGYLIPKQQAQPAKLVNFKELDISNFLCDYITKINGQDVLHTSLKKIGNDFCLKFGIPALPSVDKKTILNCVRGVEVPYADSQTGRINLIKYIEDIATAIYSRLKGEEK